MARRRPARLPNCTHEPYVQTECHAERIRAVGTGFEGEAGEGTNVRVLLSNSLAFAER